MCRSSTEDKWVDLKALTFDAATETVDFFSKLDEVKRMKKEIKRAVLDCSYGDKTIVTVVQYRFMELAQTRFGAK